MAQKISQMTEQTTASMTEAGTSDFLGGYTTTGGNANRKFSLAGLANYFLNKFKLSLGGSNQTVKAAIDALNSNLSAYRPELSVRYDGNDSVYDDLHTSVEKNEAYYRAYASFAVSHPILGGTNGYLDGFHYTDAYGWQRFRAINSYASLGASYIRQQWNGTWSAWTKEPTRAEVDALNNKVESRVQRIPADGVKSFDVHLSKSAWTCGILICNINGAGNGVIYFAITNTGITMTDMVGYLTQGNQLSATIDGKTLTISTIVGNNSFSCGCWIGDSAM